MFIGKLIELSLGEFFSDTVNSVKAISELPRDVVIQAETLWIIGCLSYTGFGVPDSSYRLLYTFSSIPFKAKKLCH